MKFSHSSIFGVNVGTHKRPGKAKTAYIKVSTVKLGNKELFDKEQSSIKEPFPATNLPVTS